MDTAVRTEAGPETGREEARAPSGARSGALIAAASLVAIALNYAFLLAAGRLLGAEDYGALAALLGLLTVVLVPTSALQMAVSRDVARHLAGGREAEASAFARRTIRVSVVAAAPLVALMLLLAAPLGELLDIDPALVLLAAAAVATAFVFPTALGVLQGYQRFGAVAAMQVVPFVLRVSLLGTVAAAGLRLGGAVLATVLGFLVSAAVVLLLVRVVVRRVAGAARPDLGAFLRYLVPVAVGLVGVTMLTNLDVLVVRARFAADEAGVYAAASAFARVAFFVPAAALAVLFPRTAARQVRGQTTGDILGRALIATAAFSGALVLAYALAGQGLVVTSFGTEFEAAGGLLAEFALAIGLFSLANVLVAYHLSRGERLYAWIVAGAVALQVGLLALLPRTLEEVVWTNVAVGAGLLLAHEVVLGSSLPALREGFRELVPAEVAARIRRAAREALLAGAGYTLLAVLVTWPLAARLGSSFIGDERNDAAGTIAWLWRLGQEGGYHLFGTSEHWLTGAPLGWEQGNALNVQWLVPYYPTYLLSQVTGELVAYNVLVLGGLVLSALAMHGLARSLGCRPVVAAWAGVAFMLLPWLVWRVNAGHAPLVHAWVLPLVLLALHAWSRRPDALRAALVGGATLVAWLTYGYFGVMAVVGACAFVLGATVVRSRGGGLAVAARRGGLPIAAVAAATLLVLVLTVPGRAEGGASIPRHVFSLDAYGARPGEFVIPPERHAILGSLLDPIRPGLHLANVAETSLYLGWLTIALAVAAGVVLVRRRASLPIALQATAAGLGAVIVAAFLFAMPSPIRVFGFDFVWTPSWLVFQAIGEVRVPSRFAVLLAASLIPVAALGAQALYDRVRRSAPAAGLASRRAAFVLLVLIGLTTLDLSPARGKPIRGDSRADVYRAVESTPEGVLAEYPAGPSGLNVALEYVFLQRRHERPLLNGARAGSVVDDVRLSLVDPGARGSAEALAFLDVTAVVTRGDALDYDRGVPDGPPIRLGEGYALVGSFPDAYRVWRVTAEPAPALVVLPSSDWGQPLEPAGGFVGRTLRATEGRIDLFARSAGTVLLTFDVARTSSPPIVRLVTPSRGHDAQVEQGVVAVPVRIPSGWSSIRVEGESLEISTPRASETSLPAVLESSS